MRQLREGVCGCSFILDAEEPTVFVEIWLRRRNLIENLPKFHHPVSFLRRIWSFMSDSRVNHRQLPRRMWWNPHHNPKTYETFPHQDAAGILIRRNFFCSENWFNGKKETFLRIWKVDVMELPHQSRHKKKLLRGAIPSAVFPRFDICLRRRIS